MRPDKRDARFCVPDLNEEEEICDFIALRVEYNWYMMRTGNEKMFCIEVRLYSN